MRERVILIVRILLLDLSKNELLDSLIGLSDQIRSCIPRLSFDSITYLFERSGNLQFFLVEVVLTSGFALVIISPAW